MNQTQLIIIKKKMLHKLLIYLMICIQSVNCGWWNPFVDPFKSPTCTVCKRIVNDSISLSATVRYVFFMSLIGISADFSDRRGKPAVRGVLDGVPIRVQKDGEQVVGKNY